MLCNGLEYSTISRIYVVHAQIEKQHLFMTLLSIASSMFKRSYFCDRICLVIIDRRNAISKQVNHSRTVLDKNCHRCVRYALVAIYIFQLLGSLLMF